MNLILQEDFANDNIPTMKSQFYIILYEIVNNNDMEMALIGFAELLI